MIMVGNTRSKRKLINESDSDSNNRRAKKPTDEKALEALKKAEKRRDDNIVKLNAQVDKARQKLAEKNEKTNRSKHIKIISM
jgi:hypothetical protein